VAPRWVLDELLRFGDVRASKPVLELLPPAEERAPDPNAGPQGAEPAKAPLPMSYARYLIRRADWFDSKMALACSGRTGGVNSDDGARVRVRRRVSERDLNPRSCGLRFCPR
jgi:hypothetical protein